MGIRSIGQGIQELGIMDAGRFGAAAAIAACSIKMDDADSGKSIGTVAMGGWMHGRGGEAVEEVYICVG